MKLKTLGAIAAIVALGVTGCDMEYTRQDAVNDANESCASRGGVSHDTFFYKNNPEEAEWQCADGYVGAHD